MTAPATPTRHDALHSTEREVDMLVVGGGVNGLAVAWDAALAGLSVLVVDKSDWGSGTSAWSSRMIHGGLKYLERYDIPLVRESLRDREWLLRTAPHLVKPLPFVLPFYKDAVHPKTILQLGMVAYDVLSFDKSVPRHRLYSRDAILREIPGLRRDGLQGAAKYYDAQVEFSERLCVELMVAAREAGATTLNYVGVRQLMVEGNRVVGAHLVDELTGIAYDVRAKLVVNVTGPWVDDILTGTAESQQRWIGGTKGTHLIVEPFPGAPSSAMYYDSEDGRPMMILPWNGRYMIGSTDVRYSGDLDMTTADADELAYILKETNKVIPEAGLTTDSILYWYTGVRPLPYVDAERTADISRRHDIHDHAPRLEGVISVIGGKLTTFRALAKHTLKAARKKIAVGPSRIEKQRLPGYASGTVALPAVVPPRVADRLRRIYGARATRIADLIVADPANGRVLDERTGLVVAEVRYAVREEEAVRLSDVIMRRAVVGWEPDLGRGCAPDVLAVMAAELGWDETRQQTELRDYEHYLTRFTVLETSDGTPARH